jgi:hypothetical protein
MTATVNWSAAAAAKPAGARQALPPICFPLPFVATQWYHSLKVSPPKVFTKGSFDQSIA